MHVVVVGCGRVGSGLAVTLETEGHTVSVIDRQAKSFRRLPDDFKGKRINGVGFDRETLKSAGIEGAGALAAVTNGDNSNIVVARVAREAFGIERVVARIYDPRRAQIYERLGIPTVPTVSWTTDRVLRKILPDTHAVEWVDPSARVCLVERTVPHHWGGKLLSELDVDDMSRVTTIARLGVASLPQPRQILQEGDVIWVAVAGDRMDEFDEFINTEPETGVHH